MTREQKKLLEPHAEHFEAMASYVRESSLEELRELAEACLAATPSNCCWATYRAALFLKEEIGLALTPRAVK